ncbi:DMT family transporter [Alisedimentitalea sp. MJ-SS2]|uniref:DMT family transporter n=1 Tax=Aliisedimentitalea sp. MJ-SS2 TaxID=3049795 RepID=UPI0029091F45|nr:DMT family transporter [Alisedimentitalea sp. MJ-SS2]MDU8929860.1 DMT family transporter [Alisedimentitalea sp. MJ-SS2]
MTNRSGMVLVFLAGVLWSTVGLGIRMIQEAEVWQIMLYRSISLSTFLFFVILFRSGQNPFAAARRNGFAGAIGALGLVSAYTGAIYSIQNTSVANAMLLFAVAPFVTAILGWIVLGERVRRATWIAIVFGVAGIVIMVSDKSGTGTMGGNLAALFSAVGFAVFTVALRWGKSSDMLPAVFLSGLFAVAITLSVCAATGLPLILTPNDGGVALAMGVGQVGLGLLLYTIGSKTVPAVELTLLSMAEVVLGPVWVWLFLGEAVSVNTMIGGVILLAAILGNAVSGMRRKPPPQMP